MGIQLGYELNEGERGLVIIIANKTKSLKFSHCDPNALVYYKY